MPVVVVAAKDGPTADRATIKWLLEDIWVWKNGDTEVQLECILESEPEIERILILMPYCVEAVDDLSHLYEDSSFQDGYPQCWPDVYTKFEIDRARHIVNVNGVEAKVGKVQARLGYRSPDCTEIVVKFDPAVRGEARIFRVGVFCRGMISTGRVNLPWREKRLRIFTYGMAPFSGSALDTLLVERKAPPNSWLRVEKHVIYVKLWEKEPIFHCTLPLSKSYPFGECEFMSRYCPPLERMASHLGKEVEKLKRQKSYCIGWDFNDISPKKGQLVLFSYYSTGIEKWLSEHWFAVFAFLLSAISLIVSLLKKS